MTVLRLPVVFLILACALAHPVAAQADIFKLDDDDAPVVARHKPEFKPEPKPQPKAEQPPPSISPPRPSPEIPAAPIVPPAPSAEKPAPLAEKSAPPPTPVVPLASVPPPPLTPAGRVLLAQFPLYRDAHAQFLKGDYRAAYAGFTQLLALARKQQAEWDGESPFAAAAYLYREKCRLAAGDVGDKAKARINLRKFCESDPIGLYRGDAFMLLAKARLDANDSDGAKPWLAGMEKWVKAARASRKAEIWEECPAALRCQIEPASSPWLEEPDYFGNPQRRPVEPSWLVNERTAAWHLDELEADWAKKAGFAAMVRGDTSKTKACWKRFGEVEKGTLPPVVRDALEKTGGKAVATESVRLDFVAKNGRMLAYPGEEHLLDAWPKAKERVLYAEFLYITADFDSAEKELREVLAADDAAKAVAARQKREFLEAMKKAKGGAFVPKFHAAGMTDAQRDYVQATLGTVLNRKGDNAGAMRCFEEVFTKVSNTVTERRCVLAYTGLANFAGTEDQRKRAAKLEDALLASSIHDPFTRLVRFWRVMRLEEEDKKADALALLAWYAPDDGPFHTFAKSRLDKAKKK